MSGGNSFVDPLHRDVLPFASTARRWDLFSIQSLSHTVHRHLPIRVQSVEEYFVVLSFSVGVLLLGCSCFDTILFRTSTPNELALVFLVVCSQYLT